MRHRESRAILVTGLATLLGATACEQRGPRSPFESHGLRAGMSFSQLDRRTENVASVWKRERLMFSVFGFERTNAMAPTGSAPRWATVRALVDTADNRVYEVTYGPHMPDTLFDKEMEALAAKWDRLTNGVRTQTGNPPGAFFITWRSADTLWSGRIHYYAGLDGRPRPSSFASIDNTWQDRAMRRLRAEVQARQAGEGRTDPTAGPRQP